MKNLDLKDAAAERGVLSLLCQNGMDCLLEADFLQSEHFVDEINQILFSCIQSIIMSGGKVELTAILSKANDLGVIKLLQNAEEISYIRSLFNFGIHKENISLYSAKLAKLKIARDIRKTLLICSDKIDRVTGDEDIQDIVSIIETPVLDITTQIYDTEENKPVVIGQEIEAYIQHKIDNPNQRIGIPTPFKAYNDAIGGGLRRATISLIGARAKVGKSLFADEVALHVTDMSIPVLMVDTEMSTEDHYNRMLANIGEVNIRSIETGNFANDSYSLSKIKQAGQEIKDRPYYYINVAGQKFENILSTIRKWIFQHVGFDENGKTKDCLIIYDYLKLMNSENINGNMQEFQALGFLISNLHNFCVKYDVPVLSFVQLNRDGITKESTDVISGSDRLVWLCTNFTLFKVKSEEEQADDINAGLSYCFNRKLVPLVSRHGACLEEGDYINVYMQGEYAKLKEGPTRNVLQASTRRKDNGFDTEPGADIPNL